MGRIVIACYRPFPGKAKELEKLMKSHLPTLKGQGLVTDRVSIMMQAEDGTIIEVFEWKSKKAIEAAHTNPEVLKMWEAYNQVCEYIKPSEIKECHNLFAEFAPLDVL